MAAIKNATYRKVINRGFTPVRYRTDYGVYHGWVEKIGRKLIHFRYADGHVRRVSKSEARYMTVIDKQGHSQGGFQA